MSVINKLKNQLAKEIYGKSIDDAKTSGNCIQCGKPAP